MNDRIILNICAILSHNKERRKMQKIIYMFLLSIVACNQNVFADVNVDSYFKSDGTYVKKHYRSDPDGEFNNNWTTKPNVNPYTGKRGTREPRYEGYHSNPYKVKLPKGAYSN